MWRRLLMRLFPQEAVDISWRREPFFGPSNLVNLDKERLQRNPVIFVGYATQQCTPPRRLR
jgi:hypothetical protein